MAAKMKTIKRILRSKMDKWINSIDNEAVREAVKRDAFITGGSIASLMIGEPIKDYDIYFRTKETTIAVAEYYVHEFIRLNPETSVLPQVREETIKNLNGEDEDRVVVWVQSAGAAGEEATKGTYSYFEMTDNADGDLADEYVDNMLSGLKEDDSKKKDEYRPVFMSQNAITLSDHVQLVIRFYGEPEAIYKNYDFIHVQQHYDYRSDTLVTNKASLESLLSRTLVYTGSLYPVASAFRMKKFLTRNWKISAGQILKICFQMRKIDWNDMKVVREQLTGVNNICPSMQ